MDMIAAPDTGVTTLVDRYAELIRELLPEVRFLSPELTRDELVMTAARLAEYRMAEDAPFGAAGR
jgi:hypothetical protein